jgi:hypothetical protein
MAHHLQIPVPADKARDTAGIVGSKTWGFPEGAGAHQRITWDDMTTEEAIKNFRDRGDAHRH